MKRLANQNLNTLEKYKQIFQARINKSEYHWFDLKRWHKLLKYYKSGDLLDIGSLDSVLPYWASKQSPNSEIYALDCVQEVVNFYNKNKFSAYPNIKYVYGNVYSLPFRKEKFSYAVMGQLLEHLEEPARAIQEAMRVLKPNGVLALSVPLEETALGEVDKEHHLWSIAKEDIKLLLKPFGKVKIKILRSQYFPIYKYNFPHILAYVRKQ